MNILRAIRRQRLVDRAYSNGYEQGRFDERMESTTGERPGLVVQCPACGALGHGVRECSLRRTCGCVKGMGRRDPKCHSYGLCGQANRTVQHLEPPMATNTHTPACTDCGCDETCTAPIQHEHDRVCFAVGCPTIRAQRELADAAQTAAFHERELRETQDAVDRIVAAFLAEAQDLDAESIMAPSAEAEQVWRDAADRIRRVAEEATR